MSDIRSDPYRLQPADPIEAEDGNVGDLAIKVQKAFVDADTSFSVMKDDVRLLKIAQMRGTEATGQTVAQLQAEADPFPQYSQFVPLVAAAANQAGFSVAVPLLVPLTITGYSVLLGTAQTLSGFNTTTGVFTAPAAGIYAISAFVQCSAVAAGTCQWGYSIFVNGGSDGRFGQYFSGLVSTDYVLPQAGASGVGALAAGDAVKVILTGPGTTSTTAFTMAYASLSIARLS